MVSSLRWLTAGESHGPALTAIIEGLPASFNVSTADLDRDLARRRLGTGRGARMKFEKDDAKFGWTNSHSNREHRMAKMGISYESGTR
jgi:chorismate synthase